MIKLPKSKTFWIFTGSCTLVGGFWAWDRHKLADIRRRLKGEAKQIGSQPATDTTRKVTVIAFAKDRDELRKIKSHWRSYAVDLFTLAGCDYQFMDVIAERLDKEIDRHLPIPEGQAPPNAEHVPEKIVTADNWLRPMMVYWMEGFSNSHKNNSINKEMFQLYLQSPSLLSPDKISVFETIWKQNVVEPRNRAFLEDGVVALTEEAYEAIRSGFQDAIKSNPTTATTIVTPRIALLPCNPASHWWISIWRFFNRSSIASDIGTAAMAIIREEYQQSSNLKDLKALQGSQ